MRVALGCIADDYTGASDLANSLARAGLRTVQTIGVPEADFPLPDADAVVVALKSRSIPAEDAIAQARAAARWLRSRGAEHILFKICSTFDSTDAGNIGPVTEALGADADCWLVLVTPAFPETGRTVYQGHLFVGAVPLNESPLKDHPLNPMRDANLVRVLARQCRGAIGLVPLAVVERGVDAVREEMARLAKEGVEVAIVDAIFERHLETIGRAALDCAISTGASGLGLGLARALIATGRVGLRPPETAARVPTGGPAVILVGSCSPATLSQIAAAERTGMPCLRLDPERLVSDPAAVTEAVAWAKGRLGMAAVLIASSAPPDEVAALQARHGAARAGQMIEQGLARMAAELVGAGARRLIVAGGETSGAVVDRLGIRAFLVGEEIAPGVPVLLTTGGHGPPLLVALKSGNFGGASFFTSALDMMA
jgi:3-dehydrotetronate 4-kinase